MHCHDVVEPGDAALQALLAAIAERTFDPGKRDRVLDLVLTLPPLSDWPTEWLLRMQSVTNLGTNRTRSRN